MTTTGAPRTVAGHRVRPPLVAAAVAVLAAAVALAITTGAPWWLVAGGLVGPDLAFLAALGGRPDAPGLMPRRAVRPYNLLHHPAGPAAARVGRGHRVRARRRTGAGVGRAHRVGPLGRLHAPRAGRLPEVRVA